MNEFFTVFKNTMSDESVQWEVHTREGERVACFDDEADAADLAYDLNAALATALEVPGATLG